MSASNRAVFVSYASQDTDAAGRICEALRAAGVEVWFDRNELRGGDAWDQRIRGQIKACALFVPVISAQTEARREGYFRLEWHLAEERFRLFAKGTPFLLPVVVDATTEREAIVPDAFFAVQWTRIPGGDAPPAFVQRIKSVLTGETGRSLPAPTDAPRTSTAPMVPAASRDQAIPPPRPRATARWAAGIGVVLLVAAGLFIALQPRGGAGNAPGATGAAPAAGRPRSIAVLPFASLNEDRRNATFIDGIHEDILTNLANLGELMVIARTSVMQYRNTDKPATQIATELGVVFLVEGSVQREAGQMYVTVKLINARSGELLWAKRYARNLDELILTLQTELAGEIAGALKSAMAPKGKVQLDRRPSVYLAVLRAWTRGVFPEIGGWRSEARGQRSEVGGQRSEVGSQRSE